MLAAQGTGRERPARPEDTPRMTLSLDRRGLLGAGAALLALPPLARPALAQGFPARPIRVLVPFAAGGTTDVQMRALCEAAGRRLGQPVVVENRTGASGTLAAQALLAERPEGYTLAVIPVTVLRYPAMQQRPNFNPLTDFTYIIQLTGYLFGVAVKADSPHRTFEDMLAWAKANPGALNYGTPGVGSTLHLTMERIAAQRGLDFTMISYRGVAENLQALLGGQIHATVDSSAWAELVKAGQLRLLVTWGAERAKRFPDVPTLKELGFGIVATSAYGVGGPKGMDPGVVRALHDAMKDAIQDPQHLAVLERFDMPVEYLNSADYDAAVRRQFEEEGALIRRLGIRL